MLKLGKETKKTQTVRNTRNPKWNESFTFGASGKASLDLKSGELVVEVKDKDTFSSESLGEPAGSHALGAGRARAAQRTQEMQPARTTARRSQLLTGRARRFAVGRAGNVRLPLSDLEAGEEVSEWLELEGKGASGEVKLTMLLSNGAAGGAAAAGKRGASPRLTGSSRTPAKLSNLRDACETRLP